MLYQGEDIKKLLPQRDPILMIDTLYECSDEGARTGLTILPTNYFIEDGCMAEPGLIEHIAQSAAAYAGYPYVCRGKEAPLGYIGEVKKFHVHALPAVGKRLETTISVISVLGDITLISAQTEVDGAVVADTQMKIFIDKNN